MELRQSWEAVLEAARRKLFEDHLGEAPIKPGDSVTVLKKWRQEIVDHLTDRMDCVLYESAASRVEPR